MSLKKTTLRRGFFWLKNDAGFGERGVGLVAGRLTLLDKGSQSVGLLQRSKAPVTYNIDLGSPDATACVAVPIRPFVLGV